MKLEGVHHANDLGCTKYPSAKRSVCCGAGCEFFAVDHVAEPAVRLCCWGAEALRCCNTDAANDAINAVVLWRAPSFACRNGSVRDLPMADPENLDLAKCDASFLFFLVKSLRGPPNTWYLQMVTVS